MDETRQRLRGLPAEETEYIVTEEDDEPRSFPTLEQAIAFVEARYGLEVPEEGRIEIHEVLPSGHSKVVWYLTAYYDDEIYYGGIEPAVPLPPDQF